MKVADLAYCERPPRPPVALGRGPRRPGRGTAACSQRLREKKLADVDETGGQSPIEAHLISLQPLRRRRARLAQVEAVPIVHRLVEQDDVRSDDL